MLVVQIVVGVFQIGFQSEVFPRMLVRRLYEEVLVPLSVGGIPLVGKATDDRSGQSTLGVVIIYMCGQSFIESCCLQSVECYVGVVACAYGVLRFGVEVEFIVAVGMLVFGIYE